ncbi:unnamed protein product [Mycena citricolor]|uniref:Uncharacterized protein n=1 Tax=Mycena citricolor TaxID=2018698 RepID=A0AAD2H7L4_9AGAR|nr:unnamed protein product [Mycena citricolor]CAK5268847.1 unnamed protein product [Mycena citricolor]
MSQQIAAAAVPPLTTWDDLQALGWDKAAVYSAVSALRPDTMTSDDQLHLNDSFTTTMKPPISSHNTTMAAKGTLDPSRTEVTKAIGKKFSIFESSVPGHEHFTKAWNNILDLSIDISLPALISVNNPIQFSNIAGKVSLVIAANATVPTTKQYLYPQSKDFDFDIAANERVKIIGTPLFVTTTEVYKLNYGLMSDSQLGTEGDNFQGLVNIPYVINQVLLSEGKKYGPTGTMELTVVYKTTTLKIDFIRDTTVVLGDWDEVVNGQSIAFSDEIDVDSTDDFL